MKMLLAFGTVLLVVSCEPSVDQQELDALKQQLEELSANQQNVQSETAGALRREYGMAQ